MIVIKIGGSQGNDVANVASGLKGLGPWVLVHGGSAAVDELSARLGHPPKRLRSASGFESRYTDAAVLDAVAMAMAGRLNTNLVAALQTQGVNAVGLSGVDGRLLVGRRKEVLRVREGDRMRIVRDDRSGTVESVNVGLLRTLLAGGYAPVLSPPIFDDLDGGPLNADADRIAAKVAASLSADTLVLLTNVPGLLAHPENPASLVRRLPPEDLDRAMSTASGGMKKKLLAAREAVAGGVARVVIADSRQPDPVRSALEGRGTVIE